MTCSDCLLLIIKDRSCAWFIKKLVPPRPIPDAVFAKGCKNIQLKNSAKERIANGE